MLNGPAYVGDSDELRGPSLVSGGTGRRAEVVGKLSRRLRRQRLDEPLAIPEVVSRRRVRNLREARDLAQRDGVLPLCVKQAQAGIEEG